MGKLVMLGTVYMIFLSLMMVIISDQAIVLRGHEFSPYLGWRTGNTTSLTMTKHYSCPCMSLG